MKKVRFIKSDMKAAYRYFTDESWSKSKALTKVWQAAWEMALDSVEHHRQLGYYEPEYPIVELDYDPHIGCYSYPNCDIDPNGCCVENGIHAEPYGHRD